MPNLCIIPAHALALLKNREITPTDIVILCSIGEHTDRYGKGCWASSWLLADKAGIARSTFFASTQRLIDAGLIERDSGKEQGITSSYRVLLEPRVSIQRDTPQESSQQDTPRPASEIPESTQQDTTTINAPFNAPSNVTITDKLGRLGGNLLYGFTAIVPVHYCDDLDLLEKRVIESKGEMRSYLAEMDMAAQGEHGYPKATPQQIGDAVRAFNGNGADCSFRLFKAYLRDSLKVKEEKAPPARNNVGFIDNRKLSRLAATHYVNTLRDSMVRSTVGVNVGHLVLPANWAEKFPPEGVKAIKSIGTGKLLSDDDTIASIALSDLANYILTDGAIHG